MKLPRRNFLRLTAGAAALTAKSPSVRAQAYPTRRNFLLSHHSSTRNDHISCAAKKPPPKGSPTFA